MQFLHENIICHNFVIKISPVKTVVNSFCFTSKASYFKCHTIFILRNDPQYFICRIYIIFLVQCSTDDKDKWITYLPVTLEQLYPVCSWQKYNFLLLCFISQLLLHFTIYSNLATIRPASCKPWHFSTFFRITRPKFRWWTVFYFRL